MRLTSYRPLPPMTAPRTYAPMASGEPLPTPKPPANPTPNPPTTGGAVGEFASGVKYGAEKIWEFIKHPLDASKREGPWRNPCDPVSLPEKIGRMVPGAALVVVGLLAGKRLGFNFGGGAKVGWR